MQPLKRQPVFMGVARVSHLQSAAQPRLSGLVTEVQLSRKVLRAQRLQLANF